MKYLRHYIRRLITEATNSKLLDMFSTWDPDYIKQSLEMNELAEEYPHPIEAEENHHPPKKNARMHYIIRFKFESREEAMVFENMIADAEFAVKAKGGGWSRDAKIGDYIISRVGADITVWQKVGY